MGPANLARFAAALNFPLLGSNVDTSGAPGLDGQLETTVVLGIGGRALGIVGVVTEDTVSLSSPTIQP